MYVFPKLIEGRKPFDVIMPICLPAHYDLSISVLFVSLAELVFSFLLWWFNQLGLWEQSSSLFNKRPCSCEHHTRILLCLFS